MKKTLLFAFAALMAAFNAKAETNVVSGSGTEEDPYVVENGSTYDVPAGGTVYAKLVADANGTLFLTESGWTGLYYTLTEGSGSIYRVYGDYSGATFTLTGVTSGTTYVWRNNNAPTEDTQVTVSFDADEGSTLAVTSADPVEGSEIATIDADTRFYLYLNENVEHVRATLTSEDDPDCYYQLSADIDPVDANVVEVYYEWGTITLYEGCTYHLNLVSYVVNDDNSETTVATVTVDYVGSSPAEVTSEISVISVIPTPNLDYPTEDDMLNFAEGRDSITVEFDGEVIVTDCIINEGSGVSTDMMSNMTRTVNDDGHTIVTVKIPQRYATYTSVILALYVTDADGNSTEDTGEYADIRVSGWYSFTVAIADARVIDTSLTYTNVEPAGYALQLDTVKLTIGVTSDNAPARVISDASAALYKVADGDTTLYANAVLFTPADETGWTELDNDQVYVTFTDLTTGEPTVITEAGNYVLNIAEMSISDVNFDEINPWEMSANGVVGTCNAEWNIDLKVVSSIPEVVSVDPAPYVSGGDFSEAIPTEVTVEFSETVTIVTAYASLQSNPRNRTYFTEANGNLVIDGTKATFTLPEEAQDELNVSIVIVAESEEGVPVTYNSDEEGYVILEYQMPMNIFVPAEVSPTPDSYVDELSVITITTTESVAILDNSKDVVLLNAEGDTVAVGAVDYDWEAWDVLYVTLTPTITEEGTYTLLIPEGLFGNLDETMYNPELSYTFNVGEEPSTTGISDAVAADGNETVKVYTVSGVLVAEGARSEVIGTLAKGLYIVGGKKVVVR